MMPFIHLLRRSQEKSSTKILTFDIAFQFGEDKSVSLLKKSAQHLRLSYE